MRILIVGDSLTYYPLHLKEELYGFILRKYFEDKGNFEVFIIGKADNHTRAQSNDLRFFYDIEQFKPDIVILHIGINDCAPRLFSELDELFLRSLPVLIKIRLIKFFSKRRHFFTKRFYKVHVSKKEFYQKYIKILKKLHKINAIPIIINIAKPPEYYLERSYNYLKNLNNYNKILFTLSKELKIELIDIFSLIDSDQTLRFHDGIHLSEKGHKNLAKILIERIENILKSK